jgi:UDP-2,4-diacetamido-2,4,6-trideoxy-beta-L-altropyranose hydrolase
MQKKVFFRVDGGESVGLGHLIRSISIQTELNKRNPKIDIQFICKYSEVVIEKLSINNISYTLIPENIIEADFIAALCKVEKPDLMFIDLNFSYSREELVHLNTFTQVFLFNNLSDGIFEVKMAVIPSGHRDTSQLKKYAHLDHFFSGLDYVVLNEGAINLEELGCNIPRSIGITTGGSDPEKILIKLIKMLMSGNILENFKVNAFFGENFQWREELAEFMGVQNLDILPYNLKELAKSEIVISTFGVSTYELLYLGKAIISVAHADINAVGSSILQQRFNCLLDLGHIENLSANELNNCIMDLFCDSKKRKELEELGPKLIDGNGVKRITEKILELI